jgi:hypothetical protein
MFVGRGDRLVSVRCHGIPLTLAKLRKAKSVEFIRVWKGSFIRMSGTGRDGDKCACGNSHSVEKCERAHREMSHGNWKEAGNKPASRTWDARKGI